VESEITSKLEPIELLSLSIIDEMKKVTRIEIHALSGISTELCEDNLDKLCSYGLIDVTKFDKDQLLDNIHRLSKDLGDDWLTPKIERILARSVVKQYFLTSLGKTSLKTGKMVIETPTDLSFIITANPTCLFHDKIKLRHNGYENIPMSPELTNQILNLAVKYRESSGVTPKFIGTNTIAEGKEVVISQLWISQDTSNEKNFPKDSYKVYLTSRSFDKWINPSWNATLKKFLPSFDKVEDLIISTLSNYFDMVEEVILEGLSLKDDRITWSLTTDLEMLMLINKRTSDVISLIQDEVSVPIPNTKWKIVLLLELRGADDLSKKALQAARFHANAPRKGFDLTYGKIIWSKIMKEWGKPSKEKEYLETIATLVHYDCITEILPDIQSAIIDVDSILSFQRRGRQSWQFNRLRQINDQLIKADVRNLIYLASEKFLSKIDEEDVAHEWVNTGKIEIYQGGDKIEAHPAIQKASDIGAHYIGTRRIPNDDEFKEMRIYSRKLNFKLRHNTIKIPGLEPFYEWKVANVLTKMYDDYYE
jgi:hypothetical protein